MTKEEAINQLQDAKDGYKEYLSNEALNMAIEALKQEPRKGSWISSNGVPYTYFNSFIVCSECGKHPKEKSDFCPNCGADMREVEK